MKVTRTITIEGTPEWVSDTLNRSLVKPGRPRFMPNGGVIRETCRVINDESGARPLEFKEDKSA